MTSRNRNLTVELSLDDRKLIQGLQRSLDKSVTQTRTGTEKMSQSWASVKASALAAGAAIASIAVTMKSVLGAYAKQEQAEQDLAAAMRVTNVFTDQRFRQYKQFASAMQEATIYGDEEILAAMANLQTYGIQNAEVMEKATKAVLDLATAKKMDLTAASELIGKAFAGETGTLSRYGIVIESGLDKTEKFAAVMQKLNEMFGGRAQAAVDTYAGKIKQLSNLFGDMREAIGEQAVAQGNILLRMFGVDGPDPLKQFIQDVIAGNKLIAARLRAEAHASMSADQAAKALEREAAQMDALYVATLKARTELEKLPSVNVGEITAGAPSLSDLSGFETGMPDVFDMELNVGKLMDLRGVWGDTFQIMGDAVDDFTWKLSENTQRQFDAFAMLADAIQRRKELTLDDIQVQQFWADAGVKAAMTLAGGNLKAMKMISAVAMIYELAQAFATAFLNPAHSASHLMAAAKYAVVAGASVPSGGRPSGGAGGYAGGTAAVGGSLPAAQGVGDTLTGYAGGIHAQAGGVTIVNVVDQQSFLNLMGSQTGQRIITNAVAVDYARQGPTRRVIRGGW